MVLPDQHLDSRLSITSDTGWVAMGAVGLRWPAWRLELEGAHRQNDAALPFLRSSGEIKSDSIMLNAVRNLDMGWKIIPYIGAGIGAVRVNYRIPAANSDSRATGGIWQLIGGATLPLGKRWEAYADYRYFDSFSTDVTLAGSRLDGNYHGHEVTAGLRWSFWQAPAPVVAAAPAPAPLPPPKDYVIYFEFNKSNITNAAGAVLDELKSTSSGQPVSVVGHTDTSGSAASNQQLSERRANATAKALMGRGVQVDSASGRGENEPAVKTGDGVKEPLNRRAVIYLGKGPASH